MLRNSFQGELIITSDQPPQSSQATDLCERGNEATQATKPESQCI